VEKEIDRDALTGVGFGGKEPREEKKEVSQEGNSDRTARRKGQARGGGKKNIQSEMGREVAR